MKLALKSKKVLTVNGLREGLILIENGIIAEVVDYDQKVDCIVTDHDELVIMPGLTDTHVHINEPGRTEWEGFETATKSAAAGGITTLVDMPLNSSPVTTTPGNFRKKFEAAKNKLYVDCGFYGGVIPGNQNELEGLMNSGVLGFKAFMIHSGIDDFPDVNEEDIRKAIKEILRVSQQKGSAQIPLLVHAEIDCGCERKDNYSELSFDSFLSSRPEEWENKAIELLIKLSREFDFHIHIVHLSSSESIPLIRAAKKEGLKITVETCPHYLFFSSEEISDLSDNDTRFKCTPPIRNNDSREKLWSAVRDGLIDLIVSDHSPCSPELKVMAEGNFEKAWGGISSLQLGLPAVWTEARKRGFDVSDISRLMSRNTSSFIGLGKTKGRIEKGFAADLVVFDPDKKFTVDENKLFHRHKVTPYSGRELYGVVNTTYLRGEKIYDHGEIVSGPKGKIIVNK
ncbi:MAG: allantoinase AllB [Ignavibacteria bacterium]